MNKNLIILILFLLLNQFAFGQRALKLNVYAGFNDNKLLTQENLYDSVINRSYEFDVYDDIYYSITPNIGLGIDYSFNNWQSVRTGVWLFNQMHELKFYTGIDRNEFISSKRYMTQIKVPFIYSHQFADIKKYRTKLKMNIGTSANFYLSPNKEAVSNTLSGSSFVELKEIRYNNDGTFSFPLLVGLEFQLYNKNGKNGLYAGITRNFVTGGLINEITYTRNGRLNTYQTHMDPKFWSFNIGYLFDLSKKSKVEN